MLVFFLMPHIIRSESYYFLFLPLKYVILKVLQGSDTEVSVFRHRFSFDTDFPLIPIFLRYSQKYFGHRHEQTGMGVDRNLNITGLPINRIRCTEEKLTISDVKMSMMVAVFFSYFLLIAWIGQMASDTW